MKLRGVRRNCDGFTLVELVISGALMSVILASSYMCLSAGVASRNMVEARSEAAQSARVALQMMAADLRCALSAMGLERDNGRSCGYDRPGRLKVL